MSIRAVTFLARSEQRLSQYIRNFDISASSTTVFALHTPPTVSASSLQTIFSDVTKLPSNNLGCISGQINPDFPFSASFLNIPRAINHHVWRSTIPGKEKAQVGRWYSKEQMSRAPEEIDLDFVPSWGANGSRKIPQLPPSLNTWASTQKKISTLLYFSDDAAEGLTDALTHHLPRVPKIGLTASSTPFITGRPYTLYESGAFHSSGAIGVALTADPKGTIMVETDSLEAIGSPMKVTSSASNMIYTLDGMSAVSILVKHVPDLERDQHDAASKPALLGLLDANGKVCRTFSISAGSPSRGALLLDGEWAPGNGTTVQFLIHRNEDKNSLRYLSSSVPTPEIRALCIPNEESLPHQSSLDGGDPDNGIMIDGRFIMASESGFSLDDGLSQPGLAGIWQCTTPHVAASLKIPH